MLMMVAPLKIFLTNIKNLEFKCKNYTKIFTVETMLSDQHQEPSLLSQE